MHYRDERDALRHRADNLSEELRTAEQRLQQTEQRLAEHEQKDVQDEEELARLRAEVERLRRKTGEVPPSPQQRPKVALIVAGLLVAVTMAGVIAGFLLHAVPPPPDAVVVAPKPAEPPPTIPAQRAFWGGEVIASEGGKANVGDGCLVEAALAPGGDVSDVVVRCGQATLYRASEPTRSGMVQLDGGHAELANGDQHLHILRYRNTGDWSGPRAKLDLDSAKHRARVFKSGAEAWSVTIHLADLSFPRKGPALAPDAATLSDVAWTRRAARRTAITGPAPPSVAGSPESCELTVHPTPPQPYEGQTLTCRVTLRCGGSIVYGAGTTGYVACPRPGDPLTTIRDEGNTEQNDDPKLTVDLAGNLATVEDG
ncbi:MAG TPA: hypothetical protein ENK57_24930, partial [Polyangiaceae bacterium]|nr:hypothetical protein [Polyangiaceae bacterium]